MPREDRKQNTDEQTQPLEERNSQRQDLELDLDDDDVGIIAPDLSRDEPAAKGDKKRDDRDQDEPETGVINPT